MNTSLARKTVIVCISALVMASLIAWLVYSSRQKPQTPQENGGGASDTPQLQNQDPGTESIINAPREITPPAPAGGDEGPRNGQASNNGAELQAAPESVSSNPLWARIISGDFIRNFVIFLDEVGMGAIPTRSLGEYRSETAFSAIEKDGAWYLSEETKERYAPFVDMFCELEPDKAARLYKAIRPSMQKIIAAMGYGDKTPDSMAADALRVLREVTIYEDDPPMDKAWGDVYVWQNQDIERLAPVQKLLMRLGQKNLLRIRTHAEVLAAEAGIGDGNRQTKEPDGQ